MTCSRNSFKAASSNECIILVPSVNNFVVFDWRVISSLFFYLLLSCVESNDLVKALILLMTVVFIFKSTDFYYSHIFHIFSLHQAGIYICFSFCFLLGGLHSFACFLIYLFKIYFLIYHFNQCYNKC